MKMNKLAAICTALFCSTQASAALETGNGFSYPTESPTYNESDVMTHEVLFFYSDDMLDYFDNDVEKMTDWINKSVEVNNDIFVRQDIPLRRKVSGVIPYPSGVGYDDYSDIDNRITLIRDAYTNAEYGIGSFYRASYVVGLNRYYSDLTTNTGRAELGGKYSWVSPKDDVQRTLAHELAHNDGLAHNVAEIVEYKANNQSRWLARDYAAGYDCGGFASLMSDTKSIERDEMFLSNPELLSPAGAECGVDDEADSTRAYQEVAAEDMRNQTGIYANNRTPDDAEGYVSLSVSTNSVNEGVGLTAEIYWEGASVGDAVQVIAKKGTADTTDFVSKMAVVYFDGENTMDTVTFPTTDDDEFEVDETFTIELIYPLSISIADGQGSETITIVSDEQGNSGVVSLDASSYSLTEGKSGTVTINRTEGTDGEITVYLNSSAGTADEDDFTEINRELVFADGQDSKTVSIYASADSDSSEGSETFNLTLSSDMNVLGNVTSATVTISEATSNTGSGGSGNSGSSGGGSFGFGLGLLMAAGAFLRRFR